jgi:hypothetical protein
MNKTIIAIMLTVSLSTACDECGGVVLTPPTDNELKKMQPLCYSLSGAFIGNGDYSCVIPSFYTEKNIMLIDDIRGALNAR